MSENLAKVIGLAAVNEDFRKALLSEDAEKTLKKNNITLTSEELAMVKSMQLEQLQEFTSSLDARISKSMMVEP